MSGAGPSGPVAVAGIVTSGDYHRRRHVANPSAMPSVVAPTATRSRLDIAIECVLYAADPECDGTFPERLLRNPDEVAIAKSLTEEELFLVAALLMRKVQRRTRCPKVRSVATRLESLWTQRVSLYRRQVPRCRPLVRAARNRPRPRTRRRARAPAARLSTSDESELAHPPASGGGA